ncbi:MAG: hypothetical protein COT74_09010 [Bdellovibrionales bacterium CG10_big_fil_rev_8_21_14_0_10_45_34]|nr:MAG: hypothetical protein COT74_09010 [Bdellovibrionales bacterium CG10_big_fil_rev_8_21_14_0_10_45_34]
MNCNEAVARGGLPPRDFSLKLHFTSQKEQCSSSRSKVKLFVGEKGEPVMSFHHHRREKDTLFIE